VNTQLLNRPLILLLLFTAIQACTPTPKKIAKTQPAIQVLTAIGYGTSAPLTHYTSEQKRLMSMRASRMDAYRNLAEQIYGVHINGQSSVSDMVLKNDSYRTYINTFLQGAKVRSITAVSSNTYETVIEIKLTVEFFRCLNNSVDATAQCPNITNSRHDDSTGQTQRNTKIASAKSYQCSSMNCYQYPNIKGFKSADD